nr:MAG TPA: hypothetical protein [Caudoviricetes sp.]
MLVVKMVQLHIIMKPSGFLPKQKWVLTTCILA